jgi:hypothetical protein
MGKEVPKGGRDLSDLLKSDIVVVFSCIGIYNDDPQYTICPSNTATNPNLS